MTSECPSCGDSFESEVGMKSHHKQAHGESLAGFEHICENCGDSFKSDQSQRKYCSIQCLTDSQKKHVEKECSWCGDKFTTIPSSDQKNCSRECSIEYMKENFSGEDSHFWKEKTEVVCSVCGESMFLSDWECDRREVCSRDCYRQYLSENYSGRDSWNWEGGYEYNYGSDWEQVAENVREKHNRRCQACGEKNSRRKISVHHIVPVREFDEVTNAHFEENLVPLCESCHSTVEQQWSLEEQIEAFNRDPDELQV